MNRGSDPVPDYVNKVEEEERQAEYLENTEQLGQTMHSSQIALFKPEVLALSRKSSHHQITEIREFWAPNIDKWLPELQRVPNHHFRTKQGRSGRQGYCKKVSHGDQILADIVRSAEETTIMSFPRAGPRDYVVFRPEEVVAAVVTCGGLCPGLNDCIQEIVQLLHYNYSVDTIYGINCGFRGFYEEQFLPYKVLTPQNTKGIHNLGGTILGSSRGGFDATRIIDACLQHGINQVYIIGGDGTHRAAHALYELTQARQLKLTIVCIPKTIDNDIGVIDQSFGFKTAVEEAVRAIDSAKVEAECTPNGIGIVKLMGRHAGFIAAHSTLAAREVDVCLVPEVPVVLEGDNGLFRHVECALQKNGKCVIVVAEGAGDSLMKDASGEKDESGNDVLPPVGIFLKDLVKKHFTDLGVGVSVKYNDPSYMIRSIPANANDSIYCMVLAQNAVHGAMAGYTGFTSALVNGATCMIPLTVIIHTSPTHLNPTGRTWERITRSTHQPLTWG